MPSGIIYFGAGILSTALLSYTYCRIYRHIKYKRALNTELVASDDRNTLYHVQDLITHVKRKQQNGNGASLFLDWYPMTNYLVKMIPSSNNQFAIQYSKLVPNIANSGISFRHHLEMSRVPYECVMELTPKQKSYLGISAVASDIIRTTYDDLSEESAN